MTAFVLTSAAESDLRDIIRYTRKKWGDAQLRRYISTLEHGMTDLAMGRGVFKDLSDVFPNLRMGRHEHHYVFCLSRNGAPSLIVAIFHERMDLMTRLADRLNC